MMRFVLVICGVFAMAACVAPAGEEVGSVEQALSCAGCGLNGLRQVTYNNIFSQMDQPALAAHGAWDAAADAPAALCTSATIAAPAGCSVACELAPGWRAWLHAPYSGAWLRDEMLENVVKLSAPKGACVVDPGGPRYPGTFGLASGTRQHAWSWVDEDYVSAGLVALLSAVPDVPICIQTAEDPTACAGSGVRFHEATFFGQLFRGAPRFVAISGGEDARNPYLNLRYGTVSATSATVYQRGDARCVHAGSGDALRALYCDGESGIRYHHPLVVLTPGAPHTWYYDVGSAPRPRPASFPR